jgi:hypothetical protein
MDEGEVIFTDVPEGWKSVEAQGAAALPKEIWMLSKKMRYPGSGMTPHSLFYLERKEELMRTIGAEGSCFAGEEGSRWFKAVKSRPNLMRERVMLRNPLVSKASDMFSLAAVPLDETTNLGQILGLLGIAKEMEIEKTELAPPGMPQEDTQSLMEGDELSGHRAEGSRGTLEKKIVDADDNTLRGSSTSAADLKLLMGVVRRVSEFDLVVADLHCLMKFTEIVVEGFFPVGLKTLKVRRRSSELPYISDIVLSRARAAFPLPFLR